MNLQAQAIVTSNTFLVARRELLEYVARAKADLSNLASIHAEPLLAALAHELSHRGGTAAQTTAYAELSLASGVKMASLWDGVVLIVAAEALARCDKLGRAETVLDWLVTAARAQGATHTESAALTARAIVYNRAGRLLEGEADARLALALADDLPLDFLRPYKLALLGNVLIEQGGLDAAARLLTPAELARHQPDQTFFQTLLRATYARLLWVQGRDRDALDELASVEQADLAWGITNPGWTEWRMTAAAIQFRLGQQRRARQLATDELSAARAFGAPRALGKALCAAALVDRDAALELLREAVAVLEGSEARLEYARALIELGSALGRAGFRADARGPLQTGLDHAHECGAHPLVERARQELAASGSRPRRSAAARGRYTLTASELRVTRMAVDGLSNREIAQALYLSLKTVEMHLAHAYDKLGIHSRVRLAVALDHAENTGH
jgi:DNA-binding CsgD family transcriptional regulator